MYHLTDSKEESRRDMDKEQTGVRESRMSNTHGLVSKDRLNREMNQWTKDPTKKRDRMTITTYIHNINLKEMMKLYPQQALLGCLTL